MLWSSRLNTTLRILLDESVGGTLAANLMAVSAVSAASVLQTPLAGASDKAVVAYATKERRIVVTTDKGMDEKHHAICTHPGIIILASTDDFRHVETFKSFIASGHRAAARNAVTYLTEHGARFRTHAGEHSVRF
jgi:predicted nuclease of predicted toxin-antitoxin system